MPCVGDKWEFVMLKCRDVVGGATLCAVALTTVCPFHSLFTFVNCCASELYIKRQTSICQQSSSIRRQPLD